MQAHGAEAWSPCSGDGSAVSVASLHSTSSVSSSLSGSAGKGLMGLHEWRSGTERSGLWFHRSGTLLLCPLNAVSWREVHVGAEWWLTGRAAQAV